MTEYLVDSFCDYFQKAWKTATRTTPYSQTLNDLGVPDLPAYWNYDTCNPPSGLSTWPECDRGADLIPKAQALQCDPSKGFEPSKDSHGLNPEVIMLHTCLVTST